MIKALAHGQNGRDLLIIGLSFGNLDRFRAEAGDTHITIDGKALGLDIDVLLISGETEADLTEMLQGGIGPNTQMHVSPRSKS